MLWGASQLLVGWDCISNNNLKHPGRLTRKKTNQKKQKKTPTKVFWFLLRLESCSVAYIVCIWSCINIKDWNSLSDLDLPHLKVNNNAKLILLLTE